MAVADQFKASAVGKLRPQEWKRGELGVKNILERD